MIQPERTFEIALRDGISTPVRVLGGGPKILFSHGSGYACDAFAPFLHALARRCEVYCFDLRGHGIAPRVDARDFSLELLAHDLHDIIRTLKDEYGADSMHGVFHSISAVLALRVQADSPDTFASIVGYEPPLAAIGEHAAAFSEGAARMATRALRRRREFASARELADRFQASGVLIAGSDEAALGLAEGVLGEAIDGKRPLRCDPAIEARIYSENTDMGLWRDMRAIRCPGLIVSGRPPGDLEYTQAVAPRIASAAGFDLLTLHGLGHLGWIEAPEKSAMYVAAHVTRPSRFAGAARTTGPQSRITKTPE